MDELIKALQIFRKYDNPSSPTNCDHDVLTICGIDPTKVSPEDTRTLDKLGFFVDANGECFMSFRFGSA